jgi:NADH:ubiquinone reductase (non-electrogenic)
MAWFRNLTKVSSIKSSLKNTHPFPLLASSLTHFSTEANKHNQAPPGLGPTRPNEKPRVVVLGTGWAGCRLMKGLDTNIYDVVCVSPRNHMVFTPLLASTCVGTLEFRSVAEPIGRIQPAISREPGSYFFLSNCTAIDTDNHLVILIIIILLLYIKLGVFFWMIWIVGKVFE